MVPRTYPVFLYVEEGGLECPSYLISFGFCEISFYVEILERFTFKLLHQDVDYIATRDKDIQIFAVIYQDWLVLFLLLNRQQLGRIREALSCEDFKGLCLVSCRLIVLLFLPVLLSLIRSRVRRVAVRYPVLVSAYKARVLRVVSTHWIRTLRIADFPGVSLSTCTHS